MPAPSGAPRELVVLSHLRWASVWQRPHHLISRFSEAMDATSFVEEPVLNPDATEPSVRCIDSGPVARVWLELPGDERHCGFGDAHAQPHESLLSEGASDAERIVWLYTPMALPIAEALSPSILVYDVMDDLASFTFAPPRLRQLQRETLERADVVFTGGRSLHRSVRDVRADAHCFPSGVEPDHYAAARRHRQPRTRPVAGYVGVIDERLDLDLLGRLAAALPDWDIEMVGPVLKIEASVLPRAKNIRYLGAKPYAQLPALMGGFDVALMPFALNESTRSISPTKTLEYLAAGLPVVSTLIPDVVTDFGTVVDLQSDAAGFAGACRRVLDHDVSDRDGRIRPLLDAHRWDTIARRMADAIAAAGFVGALPVERTA